jgi:hypothetical protein
VPRSAAAPTAAMDIRIFMRTPQMPVPALDVGPRSRVAVDRDKVDAPASLASPAE